MLQYVELIQNEIRSKKQPLYLVNVDVLFFLIEFHFELVIVQPMSIFKDKSMWNYFLVISYYISVCHISLPPTCHEDHCSLQWHS